MALSEKHIASDFQAFRSHDGESLDSQPTRVCSDTGKRYILWSDIQHAFKGAIHLEDQHQRKIMFMIDNNGEMQVLFVINFDLIILINDPF